MKKIFVFVCIFIPLLVFADDCSITCPKESIEIQKSESLLNRVTGANFASKKIAELVIQNELNDELNSNFKAKLDIFSIKLLKQGKFKGLTLKSDKIQYKAISISDFYAETICPYNQVIYKNKRLYYPQELPMKFQGSITNDDLKNIIASTEFQKELQKAQFDINGQKLFKIENPNVEIKNNQIYFKIPLKMLFASVNVKAFADIEAANNKIVLKNITFGSKSNIISDSMLIPLMSKINPISFETSAMNGKFCKIFIKKAEIIDDKINIDGIFIINKNYGG